MSADEKILASSRSGADDSHIARHTLGFYRDTSMPTLIDMETLLGEVMMVYESRLRAASIATHIDLRAQSKIRGLRGERLFEPFFTTKLNSGTGLGLWVVKPFVSNLGGQISVESSTENNNHGTAFNLFVPLVALSNPRSQSTETAPTTK